MTIKYIINEEGNISFVWRDDLIPLFETMGLEEEDIEMGKKVGEIYWDRGWWVYVGRQQLLGPTFSRSKAVELENKWAEKNLLC